MKFYGEEIKDVEDMTQEEILDHMRKILSAPPGRCTTCGKRFLTMNPRTQCSKCLGMGLAWLLPLVLIAITIVPLIYIEMKGFFK